MELNPHSEFWVTDPPATYETEGVVYLLAFSDRRKLLDFYRANPDLPNITRQSPIRRPWKRLQRDVVMLGWDGVNIDPSATGGESTLVLFRLPAKEPEPDTTQAPEPEIPHDLASQIMRRSWQPLKNLPDLHVPDLPVLPSHTHRENLMLLHELTEESSKSD